MAAVGAWAARWEIAELLQSRCDPGVLVSDIRDGREGEHILNLGGQTSFGESLKSWSVAKSPERAKQGGEADLKAKLFESDSEWDEDLAKQQAILESLGGTKGSNLPGWISGTGSSGSKPTGVTVVGPSYVTSGTNPPLRGTNV